MSEQSVRCPDCNARLRVPEGRTSVRCPKCETRVRVDIEDEEEEERPSRPRSRGRDEVRTSPRARRDEEDEDDRPRSRRRRDEEEDEDDRPRRRSGAKRRDRDEPQGDGPWLIAIGVSVGCFVLAGVAALGLFGTTGLPAGQDGPGGKLLGLGIGLVAALVLAPVGIIGVKNRRAMGKWGIEIEGSMGVATGFVQSAMGGLVGGFALYGLIFTLINGK